MKNILIVSSTMRDNGNSHYLAQEFMKGAKDAGHNVDFVSLKDLKFDFCKGCLACQKTGKCFMNDDISSVIEKFRDSDVIVLATPIYYYSVSGQLKTFLDRMNPLYSSNFKFRDFYLLATCADSEKTAIDTAVKEVEGFISCFNNTKLKDILCGTEVNNIKDILLHPEILNKAYEMGKNI